MKKKIFFAALVLFVSTSFAIAQNPQGKGQQSKQQSNNPLRPGTGIPGTGTGAGKCADFVDNNKNGICDNYENGTCTGTGTRPQDGTGNQKGKKK